MKNRIALGAALVASLMAFGTAAHAQTGPRQDLDRDGIQNRYDKDRDGDGIANARDPHPNVRDIVRSTRVARVDRFGPNGDIDRDGIRNRNDRDRDGDGVPNRFDNRPNNPNRS